MEKNTTPLAPHSPDSGFQVDRQCGSWMVTPWQQTEAASPLSVIIRVINEQLQIKKYTEHDLHCLLQKQNKNIFPFIECILDANGFNMLHQCIQYGRFSLLSVLQAHGYWTGLTEQVVSRNSGSDFAGCTPRQMAERKRMWRLVEEIDRLSQLEKSMADGNAALKASRSGNVQLLRTMSASRNADMKVKDCEGNNCVHWAAISGNLDAVTYVTEELRLQPDVQNDLGQTPLHAAVFYGHSKLISYLATKCKLNKMDSKSQRKLQQYTAVNGDVATLSELLTCSVLEPIDQSLGITAAKFGRQRYLEHILMSYDLDSMYKNSHGKTCLMVAAENGHLKMVEFLLNRFPNLLTVESNQGRNVLHHIAERGHADVAKVVLKKALATGLLPKILNQKDTHRIEQLCSLVRGSDEGRPAWHYIHLKRKYVSLFQKLTEGGRIDASRVGTILQTGWGSEPETEVLKNSLECYKNSCFSKDGQADFSPTLLAIAKGRAEVAKLFIKAGGDVKAKDCFGQTGMHLVAMRGTLDVAKELELRGLELDTKDEEGDTPLDVAQVNGHTELVDWLTKCLSEEELIRKTQDLVGKLVNAEEQLDAELLEEKRRDGADVSKHVTGTVRNLQEVTSAFLSELGSGPVMEDGCAPSNALAECCPI